MLILIKLEMRKNVKYDEFFVHINFKVDILIKFYKILKY